MAKNAATKTPKTGAKKGDVFEVRAPKCQERAGSDFRSTAAGYFTYDSIDAAAQAIEALDASRLAPGIYTTLNPVNPALLARSANRLQPKAKATTSDSDIVIRRHLLIDCDPLRPADISSTDAELALAAAKAEAVQGYLADLGWPAPIRVMSGNGHHLIHQIDLPRDDGGLVQRVLEGLAARFDDRHVKIDKSVFNAARITKIPGTMARKGDDFRGTPGVEDRPHRRAELLSIPAVTTPVSRELLEAVAALPAAAASVHACVPTSVASSSASPGFARFNHTAAGFRGYLESHGVTVVKERAKGDSTFLDLQCCPVTGVEANGTEISVMVTSGGSIAFRNLHNRGTGLEWLDVREKLEPGYKAHVIAARATGPGRPTDASAVGATVNLQWEPPQRLQPPAVPLVINEVFPRSLGAVREYAHALSESIQVPPDVPVMLMHPAVGLPMSQVVCVALTESWRQPPVHYNAVLMEPGNRKTDPFTQLLAPIHRWEEEAIAAAIPKIAAQQIEMKTTQRRIERLMDLASGKAVPRKNSGELTGEDAKREAMRLQEELAGTRILHQPQFLTGDITSEDLARILEANHERLGVFSDESEAIDIMLGRYSEQPNFQLYNKGYDGSFHRINRVGRPTVLLRRPLMQVGFAIQPEAVRDLMCNRKAKGTGLLARFGLSLPHSWLGEREINPPAVSPVLSTMWGNLLNTLLRLQVPDDGRPLVVKLSDKARMIFDDFRLQVEKQLGWSGEFAAHGLQDWGGKLCGKIGRTALTLHGMLYGSGVIQSLEEPISAETMLAAIQWAPYLAAHTRSVVSFIGFDDAFVTARRILAWAARAERDRFSAKECLDHIRNSVITKAEHIQPAINLLMERGYIRALPRDANPHRGRPASQEYILNPLWDRRSP
ncbi:MAG: DUF3987 domain-containing protein [Phycisphaerales bacterium]|nr:DUF3987 domain-containing protein [Phycisphaerales bacterium]